MEITCTRHDGQAITFRHWFPFWLDSVDGLYSASCDIETTDYALTDGAVYNASRAKVRNIVIHAKLREKDKYLRDKIEAFFSPRSNGVLTYTENAQKYTIDYVPESFEITSTGQTRDVDISLICPDPLFKGDAIYYSQQLCRGLIHFPINVYWPYQVSNYTKSEVIKIDNQSATEQGLTIDIDVLYDRIDALNVEIANIDSGEKIRLNLDSVCPLFVGDKIRIDTLMNQKNIYKIHGNEITPILQCWQAGNIWLQAHKGLNEFRMTAGNVPREYVRLSIWRTPTFWSV